MKVDLMRLILALTISIISSFSVPTLVEAMDSVEIVDDALIVLKTRYKTVKKNLGLNQCQQRGNNFEPKAEENYVATCEKLEVCELYLQRQQGSGFLWSAYYFYPERTTGIWFSSKWDSVGVREAERRGYTPQNCWEYLGGLFSGKMAKAEAKTLNRLLERNDKMRKAFKNTSFEERLAIQERLSKLGFYDAPVDGLYGKGTEAALKAYNKEYLGKADLDKISNVTTLIDKLLKANSADTQVVSPRETVPAKLKVVEPEETELVVSKEITSIETKVVKPTSPPLIGIAEVQASYDSGDYSKAFTYAQVLASQGDADAQLLLGKMFADGRGTLQISKAAHMWFNIASMSGSEEAYEQRKALTSTMTPTAVEEAQSMALTCIRSNFKDCGVAELPEQVKIAVNSTQPRPNNQPALIDGLEFQYSFTSQSTLRRKQLQYAFKQLGLYSSSIDGIWGRGTSQAITNYIKLNDLQPRNGEELYMDVLSKVPVPNSFASNNARSVNRNASNNAANRAAQQRQADMLINLGTSLMNSAIMPSSPSRSIDCYTYGNYTTCN